MGVAAEDEVNFGGTSVNPYFTFSNSTNWVVGAIAFNAALPNNPTASGAVTLGGLVVSGAASCFVTPTTWTTQRTGNWSLASNNASSPWYDGGTQTARARIPGSSSNANYDVVTIAASQTLTCDTSVTIGNGNGACLTLNGTSGNLVVNGGITLSLYGGIQHNAVNSVTLNAGAAITFVPAGALQFVWNFTYGGSGGTLVCNGTSGSPCAISTNVSGGAPPAYMATTGALSGVVGLQTATYTNFSHMGDTAGTGVYTSLNSGSGNVSITNCTFTACSLAGVIQGSGTWTGSYTLSTNTFSSSVPGTTFNYTYGGLAAVSLSNGTSGSMTVTNNYFDGYVGIGACSSAVFQYNVFGSTFFCNSPESWSTSWTTFDSNVIYAWGSAYAGQDLTVAGSFTNNYFLIDDPSVSNPHGIALMWPSAVTTINWTGNIFEFTGTDPTGNMMLFYDAASTSYCYCRKNIVLPNAGGVCTGVLCTANGNDTNLRLYVEHNTANIEGQWGTEIGHEQTVVESPNRYQSIRANLYWGTASTGFIANNVDSTTYVDIIPPANACYNGKYLVDLVTDGYTNAGASYDSDFSVTPGANDVTANPQFVDSTRNLQSWGSIFWGQSTAANTVAYLANNLSSLIPSLMSWVRAGFVPTNPSFEATGWTGDTSTTDANGTTWPGSTPGFGAMAYHAALATGSGAITLGSLGVSGSGAFGAPSSGAITLGSLTVAGAGAFASPASGAITLGSIIVAGAGSGGTSTFTGTGAITLGSLAVTQLQYLVDTFQGTAGTLLSAHTSDSGASWTTAGADWTLDGSGYVYNNASSAQTYGNWTVPSSPNFQAWVDFKPLSQTGQNGLRLWGTPSVYLVFTAGTGYYLSNTGSPVSNVVSIPTVLTRFWITSVQDSATSATITVSTAVSPFTTFTQQIRYTFTGLASAPTCLLDLWANGSALTETTGYHLGRLILADPYVGFTAPGSGAVTLGSIVVAGSATTLTTALGTITLGPLIPVGTGNVIAPASGAITLGPLIVSGAGSSSGVLSPTASGAITLGSIIVAGAGGFTAPGSGAVTLGSIVVAGSATTLTTALGTITLGPLIPVGTGNFIAPASGAITLGPLIVSGAGSSSGVLSPTASGAITLGSLIVAGAGGFTTMGSGSVALAALIVSGVGFASTPGIASGSGAITLGSIIVTSLAGAGGFTTTVDGAVIQAAIQNWFQSHGDLSGLFADGQLHHIERPRTPRCLT